MDCILPIFYMVFERIEDNYSAATASICSNVFLSINCPMIKNAVAIHISVTQFILYNNLLFYRRYKDLSRYLCGRDISYICIINRHPFFAPKLTICFAKHCSLTHDFSKQFFVCDISSFQCTYDMTRRMLCEMEPQITWVGIINKVCIFRCGSPNVVCVVRTIETQLYRFNRITAVNMVL